MRKISHSRKGFTLVEILIVIAIIVIIAGAAIFGVSEKINRANAQADAVKLHAAGGVFWTVEGGKVVQITPEEYDPSNPNHRKGGMMDMQYDEVKYIQGTVPQNNPQTYNPGGGDPIGPGGSGGSGGSGSAGQHTQSSSDMLKEFLEHYGIPYTENGGNITWNHDGDYGGQSFSDAWNQWKKDHANSTGGGSSGGGNNVSTGGSGSSGSGSGSGSGSTGGSGSSGSGSSGSGSSGSGSESGSGSTGSTGSVTSNGMSFSTGAGGGTRGVIGYTTNGNTTTFNITDLQGQQNLEMTITKNGNNYVLDMGSAKWNINYQFPGYNYSTNDSVYTLNAEQKQWLTNTYGITFN